MKALRGICAVLALLSLAGAIFFAVLPSLLDAHKLAVKRVRAKFTSPEDQKKIAAQAKALDESEFESLYEQIGSDKVELYLPPRGSLAYGAVTVFASLLKVDKPVAAREDLLPAPPAPQPGAYIDEKTVYPYQAGAAAFFLRWFEIGTAGGFAVFGAVFLLLRRRAEPA